jgi:hypothetical protein
MSKTQSIPTKLDTNALKKLKIRKKDVWRYRGSGAGSIDIEPLL